MFLLISWIIAIALAIPTYGISIIIAFVITLFIQTANNVAYSKASTEANGVSGKIGEICFKLQTYYLAWVEKTHGIKLGFGDYNSFKLSEIIKICLY